MKDRNPYHPAAAGWATGWRIEREAAPRGAGVEREAAPGGAGLSARRPRAVPAPLLRSAGGSHELLRTCELLDAGVSHRRIGALVRAGTLHRVHRGVYKVGTPVLSRDATLLAAVYAVGPGSVLSHRDAAALHGLPVAARRGAVSVTSRRGRGDRPGIRVHPTRRLHPDDVTSIHGIPVTALARTLLDLCDVVRPSGMPRLIHEAEVLGLEPAELAAARRRAPGRDTHLIAAALEQRRPRDPEEIERKLEAIALRAGFADPQRNVIVEVGGERFELDRYYPRLGLCLEADGWRVHRTPRKFNADRRRDRVLWLRAGIKVLRYTWADVTARAAETEAELARLRRGSTPTARAEPSLVR